jgi:type II secretory pathway pseudopilin PulG
MNVVRRAFTVVEILVAVAITAALITVIITVTQSVLNVWNVSTGKLSTSNQARVVLDQLSLDFQSVVLDRSVSNAQWIRAEIQGATALSGMTNEDWSGTTKPSGSDSLDLDPSFQAGADFTDSRFGQRGLWLQFISVAADLNTNLPNTSAPRAISYQIVRRSNSSSASDLPVYQLYRSELDSVDTFTRGYNLGNSTAYPDDIANPPVTVLRKPTENELIGNNVIDYGVRFRDNIGAYIFPTSATDRIFVAGNGIASAGALKVGYPHSVDIYVRILTEEGVKKIQSVERSGSSAAWWQVALENSNVYVRSVPLKSQSL